MQTLLYCSNPNENGISHHTSHLIKMFHFLRLPSFHFLNKSNDDLPCNLKLTEANFQKHLRLRYVKSTLNVLCFTTVQMKRTPLTSKLQASGSLKSRQFTSVDIDTPLGKAPKLSDEEREIEREEEMAPRRIISKHKIHRGDPLEEPKANDRPWMAPGHAVADKVLHQIRALNA